MSYGGETAEMRSGAVILSWPPKHRLAAASPNLSTFQSNLNILTHTNMAKADVMEKIQIIMLSCLVGVLGGMIIAAQYMPYTTTDSVKGCKNALDGESANIYICYRNN